MRKMYNLLTFYPRPHQSNARSGQIIDKSYTITHHSPYYLSSEAPGEKTEGYPDSLIVGDAPKSGLQ